MRVFKQRRRKGNKVVTSPSYSGRFRLPWMRSERTISLRTTDKQVAEKRLREFTRRLELEKEGLPVPAGLWGAPSPSILELLEDYLANLNAQGRTEQHIHDTGERIKRLCQDCSWSDLKDVTAVSFERWRCDGPRNLRTKNPLSPKTIKDHLTASRAFLNWMVKTGRAAENPLIQVPDNDIRGKEAKRRRGWTDEELRAFLNTPPGGSVDYRRAVFLMARTGLRKGEVQRMRWGDIELNGKTPSLLVTAASSKNRREEKLPVLPEVAEYLNRLRPAGAKPENKVIPFKIPNSTRLRKDLERAGLVYRNEFGDLDFHALRHTFATFLQRQEVPQRQLQQLMRHSDANLSANRYTDISQLPTAETVKKTPGLIRPEVEHP
jgi:integrase